jgi:hypothetical protein
MSNNLAQQWKIKHQQLNHTQYTEFNAQITCSSFNTISEQWAPVPGKMPNFLIQKNAKTRKSYTQKSLLTADETLPVSLLLN